jgi:toxin FitB
VIVLDTNVLSELLVREPAERVVAWVEQQPVESLFVTTVTQAEMLFGLALLPAGRRRDRLRHALDGMFAEDFADRLLPFDDVAAQAFADIAAARRRSGRPISQFDAQIAAICRSRGADLATRNTDDFVDCGIRVIDPWKAF